MTEAMIFDIRRHSLHDGPGIRTTIFLKGCPLRCLWCHNPEGLDAAVQLQRRPDRCIDCGSCRQDGPEACPTGALEASGRRLSVDQAMTLVLADHSYYRSSQGARGGLTLSGGEPLAQPGFVLETAKACRAAGIHLCIDTSGLAPQRVVADCLDYTDLFLFDLKCMDSSLHRRLTGQPNGLILENLDFLYQAGARIQLSYPLIPGLNDHAAELEATADHLAAMARPGLPLPELRVLPYHHSAAGKYRRLGIDYPGAALRPPDQAEIAAAAARFQARGLRVRIGGLG